MKSTSVSSAPRFSGGGRIPRGGKFNFLCGHGRRTAWDSGLGTRVHAGAGVARRASIRRAAASKASGHFISLWAAGASRSQSRCNGASGGSADAPRPSATLSWVPSGGSDGRDVGIFRRSRGPSSHHGGAHSPGMAVPPFPPGSRICLGGTPAPQQGECHWRFQDLRPGRLTGGDRSESAFANEGAGNVLAPPRAARSALPRDGWAQQREPPAFVWPRGFLEAWGPKA